MTARINTATYADKGSQRWLQVAVNHRPELLDQPILQAARLEGSTIQWLSPLKGENFVEYRDGAALSALGIGDLKRSLDDFWPLRGPCWDGLARTNDSEYFLIEAKAHIGEMVSGRSRASEGSKAKIIESLRQVQREIAPGADEVDWSGTFYQYANRLAHLHFLRQQNGVKAHLVFVYFLNAPDVGGPLGGPATKDEYIGATKVIEHYLGVRNSKISRYIHKLFVDVNQLKGIGLD